jgi:hypothetical protein
VRAFVPTTLPPTPSLAIDAALREEFDQALFAIGRLDSVSSLLPDTALQALGRISFPIHVSSSFCL